MLLDTCLVSEVTRASPDPSVLEWFDAAPEEQLYLSVLTLGEITKGKDRLPAGPKRRRLEAWLARLRRDFGDRILPIDSAIAIGWGRLAAREERKGRRLGVVDGLIAATALHHGIPVVTRNVDDFLGLGIEVVNPWRSPPAR